VSLKTGARYWVQGLHYSTHQAGCTGVPWVVTGIFELLRGAPEGALPTWLVLAVRLQVRVPVDGRVTVEASEVELLPGPPSGCSSTSTGTQEEVR
jgi:hypothetical protein